MQKNDELKKKLDLLVNKLEKSDDKNAMIRLRSLGEAIGGGEAAAAWAECDLHRLIEPESIIERYKSNRPTDVSLTIMEACRNVLIFAPLMVTWFGVSQAVDHYYTFLRDYPKQIDTPFLYLWQSGFGGSLPIWQTLGVLSLLTFGLLFLVFSLTIAISIVSGAIKERREKEAKELLDDLLDVLSAATLALTVWRNQPPINFVTHFKQIIADFSDIVRDVTQQLTSERLLVSQLLERQSAEMEHFDEFKSTLAVGVTSIASTMAELKTSHSELRISIDALTIPTRELSRQQDLFLPKVQEVTEVINKHMDVQRTVVEQQIRGEEKLRAVAILLNDILVRGEALGGQVQEFIEQQREFLAELQSEKGAFSEQQGTFLKEFTGAQGVFGRQQTVFLDALQHEQRMFIEQNAAIIEALNNENSKLTAQHQALMETLKDERELLVQQRAQLLEVLRSERATGVEERAAFQDLLRNMLVNAEQGFVALQTAFSSALREERERFMERQEAWSSLLQQALKNERNSFIEQQGVLFQELQSNLQNEREDFAEQQSAFFASLREERGGFASQQGSFLEVLTQEQERFSERQNRFLIALREALSDERGDFKEQQEAFFTALQQSLQGERTSFGDQHEDFMNSMTQAMSGEQDFFREQQIALLAAFRESHELFNNQQEVHIKSIKEQYTIMNNSIEGMKEYSIELNILSTDIKELLQNMEKQSGKHEE